MSHSNINPASPAQLDVAGILSKTLEKFAKANGKTVSTTIGRRPHWTGVKRMGAGWVLLPKVPKTRTVLCQRRIFNLSEVEIAAVSTSV